MMDHNPLDVVRLNKAFENFILKWLEIIDLEVEFYLTYADSPPNSYRSEVSGYKADHFFVPGFGECRVSESGQVSTRPLHSTSTGFAVVSTFIDVDLSAEIMNVSECAGASKMFTAEVKNWYFNCEIELPHSSDFSTSVWLGHSMTSIKMNGFTEAVLRPQAAEISAKLTRTLPWFDYALAAVEQGVCYDTRLRYVADLNAICGYLFKGGHLNFEKLTSLCDLAGNLQPVRSLITKNLAELTTQ